MGSVLFLLVWFSLPVIAFVLHQFSEFWWRQKIACFFYFVWIFSICPLCYITLIVVAEPPVTAATKLFAVPSASECGSVIAPYITDATFSRLHRIHASNPIMSQGSHGHTYGHNAVDLVAGNHAAVIAPISGQVIRNNIDGFGNTILQIENPCYVVDLWHGNWKSVRVGDVVYQGQPVGHEDNNGYTMSGGVLCNGRDGCGDHTHMNVYDKIAGRNMNLTGILERPLGATAGKKPLRVSFYDPSPEVCARRPINCWGDGSLFYNGETVTKEHFWNTAACKADWLGKTVVVPELGRFTCRDRGGAIIETSDYIYMDILAPIDEHPAEGVLYFEGWFLVE